jgi:hypothetical protein
MNTRQKFFVLAEVIMATAFIVAVIAGIVALFTPLPPEMWLVGLFLCVWVGATAATILWLIPGLSGPEQEALETVLTHITVGFIVGFLLALLAVLTPLHILNYAIALVFGVVLGAIARYSVARRFVGEAVPAALAGLMLGEGLVAAIALEIACAVVMAISAVGVVVGTLLIILIASIVILHQAIMGKLE